MARTTNDWSDALPILQCRTCGGDLTAEQDEAIACTACGRRFPIRDGVIDMLAGLEGNNRVAAEFYDGPLWPRFRIWEYVVFFFSGGIRRSRKQVLDYLPNLSGTRLLEVAIGDGSNLPFIPPDCEVYGNDISIAQLRACCRRFPRRDVRLILGEAETLPFRDHTFDNVLSFGAFNYFNDPLKSLREMARVVKPQGWVVVSDEYPNLPDRMIGRKIGLPRLDHWVMSRFMHLGDAFTEMVDRHRQLKIEPIIEEVLEDWTIRSLWWNCAYVFAGRPKAPRGAGDASEAGSKSSASESAGS